MVPIAAWMAIVTALGLALHAGRVFGDPILEAATKGRTKVVTLYNEPCALPAVKTLPRRATWDDKATGKRFEGCYGRDPDLGIVLFYFDDLSVVGLVEDVFRPITPPPPAPPRPST